jgi:hypothetical protein
VAIGTGIILKENIQGCVSVTKDFGFDKLPPALASGEGLQTSICNTESLR